MRKAHHQCEYYEYLCQLNKMGWGDIYLIRRNIYREKISWFSWQLHEYSLSTKLFYLPSKLILLSYSWNSGKILLQTSFEDQNCESFLTLMVLLMQQWLLFFYNQHFVCHFSGKNYLIDLNEASQVQSLGEVNVPLAILVLII